MSSRSKNERTKSEKERIVLRAAESRGWGPASRGAPLNQPRRASESEIDAPRRAAVHGDAHAGDERGARRYQEADEIGDVLGRRDPLERILARGFGAHGLDALALGRSLLADHAFPATSRGCRRRYRIDENVRRRAEVGETLREGDEPRVRDPA